MQADDSAIAEKISRAQGLVIGDDPETARALYQQWWEEASGANDHYQACIVAHFMAHAQSKPSAQLRWHRRALSAADAVGDERVRGFYPSLYANVAEVNLRLGDRAEARRWIARARETAPSLPDDGYGRMIRSLIDRVEGAVG